MTRIKRPAAAAGAAVLLAFSLAACGGGPAADAPTDASEEDFCDAYLDASQAFVDGGGDEEGWKDFQDGVEKLADVGTPKGISEEERAGFEAWVEVVLDTDYDADADINDLGETSADEAKDISAFSTWAATTCISAEIPSDIPTDIPTDISTE